MPSLLALALVLAPAPQVVEESAQQISERYVLIERAPRIADQLLENSVAGKYDALPTPAKLAEALTDDLRRISGDLHFAVRHDPALAARLVAEHAAQSKKLPELAPTADELERMRRSNYGFRRVEILAG